MNYDPPEFFFLPIFIGKLASGGTDANHHNIHIFWFRSGRSVLGRSGVGLSFHNVVWSMYPVFVSMDKFFLIQVTFMMFLFLCSSLHSFMGDEGCVLQLLFLLAFASKTGSQFALVYIKLSGERIQRDQLVTAQSIYHQTY